MTLNVEKRQSPTDLAAALQELCRRYGVVAMYAFGSRGEEVAARVRGAQAATAWPDSDVDIGVLPARESDLAVSARVDLMQALEDLFDVARVDLVILPKAPPYLALDVVRGELLCATDMDTEAEYQLYVLRRAGDLASFQRTRMRMILAGEAI